MVFPATRFPISRAPAITSSGSAMKEMAALDLGAS
jgi:hypothetical protein